MAGADARTREACDIISQELYDMASTLFDEDDNARDERLCEFLVCELRSPNDKTSADQHCVGSDILYVNSIELDERWRGYGIGLLAMSTLLDLMVSRVRSPIMCRD